MQPAVGFSYKIVADGRNFINYSRRHVFHKIVTDGMIFNAIVTDGKIFYEIASDGMIFYEIIVDGMIFH